MATQIRRLMELIQMKEKRIGPDAPSVIMLKLYLERLKRVSPEGEQSERWLAQSQSDGSPPKSPRERIFEEGLEIGVSLLDDWDERLNVN